MKRIVSVALIAVLTCLFLIPEKAEAADFPVSTRVATLGGRPGLLTDRYLIWRYPHLLLRFPDQVTLDVPGTWGGVNVSLSDEYAAGIYTNRWTTSTIPYRFPGLPGSTYKSFDLIGAKRLSKRTAVGLLLTKDAYYHLDEGADRLTAYSYWGVIGSMGLNRRTYRLDASLEVALVPFKAIDNYDDTEADGSNDPTDDIIYDRIAWFGPVTLSCRYIQAKPVKGWRIGWDGSIAFVENGYDRTNVAPDPDTVTRTVSHATTMSLGPAVERKLTDATSLVGQAIVGVNWTSDGDQLTGYTWTLPGLSVGLETEIRKDLVLRFGMSDNHTTTFAGQTATSASQTAFALGLGWAWRRLVVDAAVNLALFNNGVWIISGIANNIFPRVTAYWNY